MTDRGDLVMLAEELSRELTRARREIPIRCDDEVQRETLALIATDLSAAVEATVSLARSGRWQGALALLRPCQERAESLVAAHAAPDFAARYWEVSQIDENRPAPRMREGEARGAYRRKVKERLDDEIATHLLEGLIANRDWMSAAVHPSAAWQAFAYEAQQQPRSSTTMAAERLVAMSALFALASFTIVAEEQSGREVADPLRATALAAVAQLNEELR